MGWEEDGCDEGLVEPGFLLTIVFFALFVLVVHFGTFLYFPPINRFIVSFHCQLRVEDLCRGEYQVIGPEVRLVGEKILQEGGGGVVLIDVWDIEEGIDGFEDRPEVRMYMGGIAAFYIRPGHQQDAAVGIYMV